LIAVGFIFLWSEFQNIDYFIDLYGFINVDILNLEAKEV